jgi:hypothetical protein
MRKQWWLAFLTVGLFVTGARNLFAQSNHRVGAGVNYWTVLDDLDANDIDKNGLSGLASYQRRLSPLLKAEAVLEVFSKKFHGIDDEVYAPQAYLVLGSTIYAAAGIGILYANDSFAENAFYAARAGLDLEILPSLYLDINVHYRFADTTNLSATARNIGVDTLMTGAALRLAF